MSRMSRAIVVWGARCWPWPATVMSRRLGRRRCPFSNWSPRTSPRTRCGRRGDVFIRRSPRVLLPRLQPDHGAVLKKYCVTCHNEKLKTGGFSRQDDFAIFRDGENGKKSCGSFGAARCHPRACRGPTNRRTMWVATPVGDGPRRLAAENRNPGRVSPFHRLTRTEYRNAIRDLLALNDLPKGMDLEVLLPADNSSTGFDNLADLLFVSSTQLEQYLSAAQKISRLAVGDPTIPPIIDTYRMSTDYSQDLPVEGRPPARAAARRSGRSCRSMASITSTSRSPVRLRDPVYLELIVDVSARDSSRSPIKVEPEPAVLLDPAPPENAPKPAAKALELDPAPRFHRHGVNRRFERTRRKPREERLSPRLNVVLP